LLDLFEKNNVLTKEGNKMSFVTEDGEVIKLFRKGWESNEDGCLDKVMAVYGQLVQRKAVTEATEEVAEIEEQ